MFRRVLAAVVAASCVLPSLALAQPLAAKLPADRTFLYAEVRVETALEQGEELLRFIDQESADKIVFQVGQLHEEIRELAAAYEFQPALLDRLTEVQLYVVIMAKDEPEVVVHTYQVPKWDPETYEVIPDQFEENTYTETTNYVTSLVVEAPDEETAADFIQQLKALIDREMEKHPEYQGEGRKDIEVEQGELIGEPDGNASFGRLGSYLIFSDGNPKELWAALMSAPADAVIDTPAYKRLVMGELEPQALLLVNIQIPLAKAERELKGKLDEAQAHAAEEGTPEGRNWELMSAQMAYNSFSAFKNVFSLNECKQAGARACVSATGDRVISDLLGLFVHGQNISPVLEELLTGSGSYVLPPTGELDSICTVARVNPSALFDAYVDVISAINPMAAGAFAGAMQEMKNTIGADVPDILGQLDSDFYVFVDVVEKEVEEYSYEYDEATDDFRTITEKRMRTVPETTVLLGVKDPQAAADMLSRIFATASPNPDLSQLVSKRTYQETDVFCIGMDVTKEEVYPDGTRSFAIVVMDRYVALGSWEHVTGIIRRLKADTREVDRELADIVAAHQDSNVLLVVPAAYQKKLEELIRERQRREDFFKELLDEIDGAHLYIGDEQLAERIRTSLTEIVTALKAINDAAPAKFGQTQVMSGTHRGLFYELESKSDVPK